MTTTPVTADALVRGRDRRTAPRTPDGVRDLRRAAVRAVGCPARAPSTEALALGWRLRADAALLAAAYAITSTEPARREDAARLRRVGQAWAAGARRLSECTPRRLAWVQCHLARYALLPVAGAAYARMGAELAVWRLVRLALDGDERVGGAA